MWKKGLFSGAGGRIIKKEKRGEKEGEDCRIPSKYLRHYTGCLARASALAFAPAPSVRCACYL